MVVSDASDVMWVMHLIAKTFELLLEFLDAMVAVRDFEFCQQALG